MNFVAVCTYRVPMTTAAGLDKQLCNADVTPANKLQPAAPSNLSTIGLPTRDALPLPGASRLSFSSSVAAKAADLPNRQVGAPPPPPMPATGPAQSPAGLTLPAVPALPLSSLRFGTAEPAPWSSRSTDSTQPEVSNLLETSQGSITGKSAIKRSFSAKVPSVTTYSGRYATRQGSISIKSPPAAATPERRPSMLTSPTASIHGGASHPVQSPSPKVGKPGGPLPQETQSSHAGSVLAGAAAKLRATAAPSAAEGQGWHMATADGLPFCPKGSLVASSGGSRALLTITSQQEALFDTDGNQLPRDGSTVPRQLVAPAAAVSDSSELSQSAQAAGKTDSNSIVNSSKHLPGIAPQAAGPAKAAPPKRGILQLALSPCFCFRPRTQSSEDAYPQQSLRNTFTPATATTAKAPTAQVPATALTSKAALPVKASSTQAEPPAAFALKAKGRPDGGMSSDEAEYPGWDLKAEQLSTGVASSLQELGGSRRGALHAADPSLQGAISLAPKHALAAAQSSAADADADDVVVSEEDVAVTSAGAGEHAIANQTLAGGLPVSVYALYAPYIYHQHVVHGIEGGEVLRLQQRPNRPFCYVTSFLAMSHIQRE